MKQSSRRRMVVRPLNKKLSTDIVDDDSSSASSKPSVSSSLALRSFSTLTTKQGGSSFQCSEEKLSRSSTASHSSLVSDGDDAGAVTALPSAQQLRNSRRMSQQLSAINRLNFDKLGLYGREKEVGILEMCLPPQAQKKKQVIFLTGFSGTGKTSLAFSLRAPVQRRKGMFCSGKFDLQLRDVPYSGIAQACNDICSQILSLSENDFDWMESSESSSDDPPKGSLLLDGIRTDLREGLGENQKDLLVRLIPTLHDLLSLGDLPSNADISRGENDLSGSHSSLEFEHGTEESLNELNYAFQSFLRLVSSRFSCLAMVLDDLQWADMASISLIEKLLTNREDFALILLGALRSNEVPSTHPLYKSIRDLKHLGPEYNFSITELPVRNLTVSNVKSILTELLSLGDHQRSDELAELCFRRTEGNPFFLLYFVRMMEEREILQVNLGSFQWTWDLEKAQKIGATDNIVDMLEEKMRGFPDDLQRVLLISACLGSHFKTKLLQLVWRELAEPIARDEEEADYNRLLSSCIDEGFLEQNPATDRCYWVHDKLQEAALHLKDDESLASMKQKIGKILTLSLDKVQVADNLFLIVNLINAGTSVSAVESSDESLDLAKLNLQAAQKASSLSAFSSATRYAEAGISLLPDCCWTTEQKLSLSLYTHAAEAECFLAKFESMQTFTSVVISRNELSLLDKMKAYCLDIHQMHQNGNIRGAHRMTVDLLGKLGMNFPKNRMSIGAATIRAVIGIKNIIAKINEEDIMKIPLMTDKKQLEVVNLLERLCLTSYFLKSDLLPFVVWKSLDTTMKYGMSKNSVNGFMFGGLIVAAVFSDFSGIARLGDALLKYFEQPEIKSRRPRVLFSACSFWLPWTRPLQAMTKALIGSYQKALEAGDIEPAFWCIYHFFVYSIVAGKPLHVLREDCLTYIPQAYDLKLDTIAAFQRVCLDAVLKLIGEGDENHPEYTFGRETISDLTATTGLFGSDSPLEELLYGVFKVQIHVIFNEFDVAADLAVAQGDSLSKGAPGNPIAMLSMFYSSFALFVNASLNSCSKKNARKLVKLARKKKKIIKDWVKKDNPNVVHYDHCLDAETARYNGKLGQAEIQYQKAITFAARAGFIHDAGLFSERYSDFLINTCDPPQEKDALFHLDRSIEFYTNWGSTKKVEMLMEARKLRF